MSVTPNFSWPLIEPTDFVTNLPADLETLADDIDADVWAIKGTADAAIPKTIIDAAGDLIYGTAADTAARLAIGTAGQVLKVNSGATAPEWGTIAAVPNNASATVTTSQSLTDTSYSDLATSGPAVTLTTGTKALVIVTCSYNSTNSGGFMGYGVSGATTLAAADVRAGRWNQTANTAETLDRYSMAFIVTGLTAGSNTFTAKYRCSVFGGTGTWFDRQISVIDMGS